MCYSALIKANVKKLAMDLGARVDLESFARFYALRLAHPELKVPLGLDRYFLLSRDPEEQKIAPMIRRFHEEEKARIEASLAAAEAELRALSSQKSTAALRKKSEVLERKLTRLKIKRHATFEQISPLDDRIFPGSFAPVMLMRDNERTIVPMRYRVRTPAGVEIPSQYNVFNARRDSLLRAPTWKPLFGRTHALFPFLRFYEWVERAEGSTGKMNKVEIAFSPSEGGLMWAASLYSPPRSKEILPFASFAMVTDDPPQEVALAGHDRCPVFLRKEVINEWINPQDKTPELLLSLLDKKEKTFYLHDLVA